MLPGETNAAFILIGVVPSLGTIEAYQVRWQLPLVPPYESQLYDICPGLEFT